MKVVEYWGKKVVIFVGVKISINLKIGIMESLRIKYEGVMVGGERIVRGVSKSSGADWEMLCLLVEGDDKSSVFVSCFGGVKRDVEGLCLQGGERVVVEFDVKCKGVENNGEERWFTNLELVRCERVIGVGVKDAPDNNDFLGEGNVDNFDLIGDIKVDDDLPF